MHFLSFILCLIVEHDVMCNLMLHHKLHPRLIEAHPVRWCSTANFSHPGWPESLFPFRMFANMSNLTNLQFFWGHSEPSHDPDTRLHDPHGMQGGRPESSFPGYFSCRSGSMCVLLVMAISARHCMSTCMDGSRSRKTLLGGFEGWTQAFPSSSR